MGKQWLQGNFIDNHQLNELQMFLQKWSKSPIFQEFTHKFDRENSNLSLDDYGP